MSLVDNVPCGCDSRKEIMGADDWQMDAIAVGVVVLVVVCILAQKGLT